MPTSRSGALTLLSLATILVALSLAGAGEANQDAGTGRAQPARPTDSTALAGPIAGSWDSGIAIQNLSSASQLTTVEFYDGAGMRVDGATLPLPLPPYGSETVWLPSVANLPDGNYTAVINAEGPVAYVNLVINQANHMGGAYTNSSPADRVEVPLVYRWGGADAAWYTKITIENTGTSPTRPMIRFYGVGEAVLLTYLSAEEIPPLATRTFDLTAPEFAALGNAFTGGASITTDQPIVVLGAHYRDDAYKMLAFATGIDLNSAGTISLAPLVYKNFSDGQGNWKSTLQIKNTSSFAAQVRITYRPAREGTDPNGGPSPVVDYSKAASQEYTIPANASVTIDPQSATQVIEPSGQSVDLPDGFLGSAIVDSVNGATITGVVLATNYEGGLSGAYNMLNPIYATGAVAAPLLYKNFDNGAGQWTSRVQLQNTSVSQEARVVVTYRPTAASGIAGGPWRATDAASSNAGEVVIPPAGSVTFRLAESGVLDPSSAAGTIPDGFLGSAILESANGVKVVGTVITTNYERGIGVVYNGISY